MSGPVSIAAKHLMAAGVTGDALVTALAEIEAASQPSRSKGAERQARYRERHKASQSVTSDVKKEIPQTPLEKTTPLVSAGARRVSRGTRMPDGFVPIPNVLQLARNLGFSEREIENELETQRDWARQAPGAKGVKTDWNAFSRNWFRSEAKKRKPINGKTTRADAFAILDAVTDEAIRREGRWPDSDEADIVELSGLRESAA